MPRKETSPAVSKLAADYMNVTGEEIWNKLHPDGFKARDVNQVEACDALADDIRTIAASAVSQDETEGE